MQVTREKISEVLTSLINKEKDPDLAGVIFIVVHRTKGRNAASSGGYVGLDFAFEVVRHPAKLALDDWEEPTRPHAN